MASLFWRRFLLPMCLLVISCGPKGGLDPLGPATVLQEIPVGRSKWSIALHTPPHYSLGSIRALVIVLHGYSGNGPRMEHESGFSRMADSLGFVVAYPNGNRDVHFRRHWSEGDTVFFRVLIDTLVRRYALDPRRVYVTGYSNGGTAAYRIATVLSDRVAAIGVVSGTLGREGPDGRDEGGETPPRPVPAIIFHGLEDRTISFDRSRLAGRVTNIVSPPRSVALWARANGCNGSPVTDTLPGGEAIRSEFSSCALGGEVTFYTLIYGGHDWPDVHRAGAHIPGSALMWDFFVRHPRGG
ncbi:MAG TPA: PHB depolymerase family esterase [Gemmatimonadaceae bacterium]|nr:PHB depolymerase family esterase [Gemmatimonadaceae bacterium]